MIDKIHAHILDELRINARADTVFILVSVLLNMTTLGVNSALASNDHWENIIIMAVFMLLTVVVSLVAEVGLIKGRQASKKLIQGLIQMYEDNNVGEYYDKSLLNHYKLRYNLFVLVILATGIISILVPALVLAL